MRGRVLGALLGPLLGFLLGWGGGTAIAELAEMSLDPAVFTVLVSIAAATPVGLIAGLWIGAVIDRRRGERAGRA